DAATRPRTYPTAPVQGECMPPPCSPHAASMPAPCKLHAQPVPPAWLCISAITLNSHSMSGSVKHQAGQHNPPLMSLSVPPEVPEGRADALRGGRPYRLPRGGLHAGTEGLARAQERGIR